MNEGTEPLLGYALVAGLRNPCRIEMVQRRGSTSTSKESSRFDARLALTARYIKNRVGIRGS